MSNIFNVKDVKQTRLYKELTTRNNPTTAALVSNIPDLCEEAAQRAKLIPDTFPQYTLHDETHFLRVTELMYLVLGDTLQVLNDIEICLLILSAFYHDQGMVLEGSEYGELMKNEDYVVFRDNWIIDHPNYTEINEQCKSSFLGAEEKKRLIKKQLELDAALLTDYLRDTHGERGHDYIKKQFKEDKRLVISNVNIAGLLAKICISHTKSIDWIEDKKNGLSYDELIGTREVNSMYLGVVLRLADILDFDADRTPDILFKSIHFTNSISINEWQKHRSVQGWKITKDSIQYSMEFEHPVYEKAARNFLDWIDSELYDSHTLVRRFPASAEKYKLNIPEKVDRSKLKPKDDSYIYHDLEFSLSRDEIIKLLMTDKLYGNPSMFIRELLQNSLDALRLRKAIYAKDNIDLKDGKVIFRHYIDDKGQQVVECKDNGCGMDEEIVKKYLGKVGRSYYRSPEFERQRKQLKEKGVDFDPCSQFGIGFMSCFMVGDRIEILTRKDYGNGKAYGKPLSIEINGLGGIFVIREGNENQEIGTTIKVYCRDKPLVFDEDYDRIRLLRTLDGYALATEFTVEATCEIDGIKGGISIPIIIDKRRTFLEQQNIKSIKVFEVDLSDIDIDFGGFMSQSFLVDEEGLPCIKNEEGEFYFDVRKDSRTKETETDIRFEHKAKFKSFKTQYQLNKNQSICLDGILVCGEPGRKFMLEEDKLVVDSYNNIIDSEHEFILDIRGTVRPELTPARVPDIVDGYIIYNQADMTVGWRTIQRLINVSSGKIWEQILNYVDKGLQFDVLWKLLVVYDGDISNIVSKELYRNFALCTTEQKWLRLNKIVSVSFKRKEICIHQQANVVSVVSFPVEFNRWLVGYGRILDRKYILKDFLISISKINLNVSNKVFFIRDDFSDSEIPNDSYVVGIDLFAIPFENSSVDFVVSLKPDVILNVNNPLIQLLIEGQYKKQNDPLYDFSYALVYELNIAIRSSKILKKKLNSVLKVDTRKHAALLFVKIDWSKYSKEYHPPYKIFVNDGDVIVITKEDFERWAK